MNKHEAVWNWLLDCQEIKDVYFNFSQNINGHTVLIPQTAYNDHFTDGMQFIDGSGFKTYIFTIVQFEAYSTLANSAENIAVLLDIEKVAQWIDKQNRQKNYPEFPDKCTIQKLEVLPFENGGLAGQDETGAKYMFSVQINYLKESENTLWDN